MNRSQNADGRSGLALLNRPVARSNVGSNAAASSGQSGAYVTCAPLMKPGAITTGTNFGGRTKDSARMHPSENPRQTYPKGKIRRFYEGLRSPSPPSEL